MIDENRVEAGALSAAGVPAERVLEEVRALRAGDAPTHGGRLFAYVYDPAVPGLDELAAAAHQESAHVNGLDPTAFPSLLAMENALVAAAGRVLGAGPGTTAPDVVGSVTSGGTESLILAVKTARDAHPEIAEPRIVVPSSAHAAFAKAAHYLRVALDVVPVSPETLRPDPAAMAAAIRPETVLVACSAPSYAHGVVDPVAQIAAAAAEAGVRCHVDACFGGWTLPYLRRLGEPVPRVRLRGARCHLHLGRPAQVRVRAEGGVGAAAPRRRPACPAVLRVRRLARLHDDQPGDRVHPLGRPDRRRVRHRAAPRRRRLPAAGRQSPGTRSPGWPTPSAPSTGCG